MSVTYDAAPVKVRSDLTAAHAEAWRQLGQPGTWFTGLERIAIARASRDAWGCRLCADRKAALSPYSIDGDHDVDPSVSFGDRTQALVDVVHRITTDAGRLSRRWHDGTAEVLTNEAFVELVAIVSKTQAIDVFCQSLGVPPHPFPEAEEGEPSRIRCDDAVDRGAYVPIRKGGGPIISRALSLVRAEQKSTRSIARAQYVDDVMDVGESRALTRPQMELIAARVSAITGCFY